MCFLHFPFPFKAFVFREKEIGVFGEQLLAFQDWTRWSNLVRAPSMSNKMSKKVKLKQACRGKQTTVNFNPKSCTKYA